MKNKIVAALFTTFIGIASLLSSPAHAEESRDTILRGYAAVLGRAGVCGMNIEPQFMRVMMWVETRYREKSNQAVEEIFFPELEGNAGIQKSGKGKEDCPAVQTIYKQTVWP